MRADRYPSLIDTLHLFGLCTFAVGQPLYAVLSRSPEFFVAHRAAGPDVLLLTALISLAVPAVLLAVEFAVGLVAPCGRRPVHLGIVAILLTFVGFVTTNRVAGMATTGWIEAMPFAFAALGAVLYAKSRTVLRFVTIASVASLLLPLNFLFVTPVSALVLPARKAVAEKMRTTSDVPVVVVVFDEFNPTALLDESRNIDPVRFPSFAALARDGWWFPNATAAGTLTVKAVPAILSGEPPDARSRLPSVEGYPNNLFSLLAPDYDLNVAETVTELCPRKFCRGAHPDEEHFDTRRFAEDLGVVFLRTLVPASYADSWLPSLDSGWKGFGEVGAAAPGQAPPDAPQDMIMRNAGERIAGDRPGEFRAFVDRVAAGRRTLDFVHVLLPHDPYDYLPDGSRYAGGNSIGRLPDDRWADDPYLVDLSYQRFLLQVGLVDRLLGELVARLKAVGKYDDALVIVTADHGKSFRPGVYTRNPLVPENAPDLLQIPMFVKLPRQAAGIRSERPVSSLDVLPTVAATVGTTVPWPIPGHPMTADTFPQRPTVDIYRPKEAGGTVSFRHDMVATYPMLDRSLAVFGSNEPLADLSVHGQGAELLGRSASDLVVTDAKEDFGFSSDDWDALAAVDPSTGRLPVYLRGVLAAGDDAMAGRQLFAFAVNGVVRAVVPSYTENGETRFAVVLPPAALRPGTNDVRLYRVTSEPTRKLVEITRSP